MQIVILICLIVVKYVIYMKLTIKKTTTRSKTLIIKLVVKSSVNKKVSHYSWNNITHIIQQFQSRFGWGGRRQFPPEFWRGGGNLGGRIGRCSGEYRIIFSKTINLIINLKNIHKNAIWRELLARTVYSYINI